MADAIFARAVLALRLLAVDPAGLGGMVIRARSGPVRQILAGLLADLPLPQLRLHPTVGDDMLYGGINLSATLSEGRVVQERGLLRDPAALVLTMAERCPPGLAARLAAALDTGPGHLLIALDEGAADDEALPAGLAERCAFAVDLTEVPMAAAILPAAADLAAARARLAQVATPDTMIAQITELAARFGIDSLRAPLFALRAARAHAALLGHPAITEDDLAAALELTLPQRATRLPAPEEPPEPPPPPEDQVEPPQDDLRLPDELLLEAVRALLPPDLLAILAARKARSAKGSGTGAAKRGNRRGRPLPARPGRLGDGARIDLVATLRTAAPWQTIRRQGAARPETLQIRPADIRLRRFEEKSDRLLIFTVDASGSAAIARLAEAKGAVELLLAQAYARRDHVALVAFRGTAAEVLLPPTRSLVQTKRRLAGLPGGGGTPLAAGLAAALAQADHARRRGLTPTAILLTDGRANITLDGMADRVRAAEDAMQIARALRMAGIETLVIDTGQRPEPGLRRLAEVLGGPYLPLPRADAARLSGAVAAALGD